MKVLVPVKRVIDYNVKVRVKPDGSGVDLAKRDLVGDQDRRLEARAAGALEVEPGGVRIESARQDAFTREVEIPRMPDRRACDDVAEAGTCEVEFRHERAQRRGQHVLVADRGVGAVRPCKRDALAADDGDASNG